MRIQTDRLHSEIEELATFSEHPAPAVTRVLFGAEDRRARRWLEEKCRDAGLETRFDAVGNFFARRVGTEPHLAPMATGSHTDAIPNAGRFDGVVGVLGGLEALRALDESGVKLRHSVDLIMFTSEEPTRFGIGCLGSRLMSGALNAATVATLRDPQGLSLDDWRSEAGLSGDIDGVRLTPGSCSAFIELHIEQGPILEREGLDIGIVEQIAAPAALRIRFHGKGGHAGALLMPDRSDAGLGAAEAALALERLVLASGSEDTVGTTGVVRILPGAINSVPCEALIEMDIRDTELSRRDSVLLGLRATIDEIASRRGLTVSVEVISADPPATCDPALVATIERTAHAAGLTTLRMVSRAYHDSLFMSRIAPTTMIFVPCHNGYSHRPDEYSSPEQIERGVVLLAESLRALDAV